MSKRIKRISKAMDSALIKACESYGPARTDTAGGFTSTVKGSDSSELRGMLDLWWRFNVISGTASGPSDAFERGSKFDSADYC